MGCWSTKPCNERRTVVFNCEQRQKYCGNEVVTSRYTVVSFGPKYLFEQFQKISNVYFLFISILQMIPSISTTNGFPSIAVPLVIVLVANGVKEAYEDWRRHKADEAENNQMVHVVNWDVHVSMLDEVDIPPEEYEMGDEITDSSHPDDESILTVPVLELAPRRQRESTMATQVPNMTDVTPPGLSLKRWRDLEVGDLVCIHKDERFPADIQVLTTSDSHGLGFVETSSLDGETNLKIRQANAVLARQLGNNLIPALEAAVAIHGSSIGEAPNPDLNHFNGLLKIQDHDDMALTLTDIFLRGCRLKNTEWAICLVLYTGDDTKIQRNGTKAPTKSSRMEKNVNSLTLIVFIFMIMLCLVSAITAASSLRTKTDQTYLDFGTDSAVQMGVQRFFTWMVLLSNLIPISLIVTLGVVKVVQAYFIAEDETMYHGPTESGVVVRNSVLNEELGQVQYLLTDKTGTLTQNLMEFKSMYCGGETYMAEDGGLSPLSNASESGIVQDLLGAPSPNQREVFDMLLHLAVNHAVITDISPDGEVKFSSSSPDEEALVCGARYFGGSFLGRDGDVTYVRIAGDTVAVQTLLNIEFTSARKMSTAVVQYVHPLTGEMRFTVFTKGADSSIIERAAPGGDDEAMKDATAMFATSGLRTLCMAKRDFTEEAYNAWNEDYLEASRAMDDREGKLNQCYDELERDFIIQGVTGIEDKLQEGVGDTITALLRGGIKIWMLTGDKLETALNIGIATSLLTCSMHRLLMPFEINVEEALSTFRKEMADTTKDYAMIIDGRTLSSVPAALQDQIRDICLSCKCVIFARVTPLQKGEVVNMLKRSQAKPVVLSIGDGANDCVMIQAADVGVGLRGSEGMQAFNSSDYGLSQFRFLKTLLLVHGRWNYRRVAKLILYMYYKNMVLVMPIFYFASMSLYSGQKLYVEITYQLYNVILTSMPITVFGIMDRDLSREDSLAYPELYALGRESKLYNSKAFIQWLATGLLHSIVCFIIPTYLLGRKTITANDAVPNDLWFVGQTIFLCVMITVNSKVLLEAHFVNSILISGVAISLIGWFVFMNIASAMSMFGYDVIGFLFRAMQTPMFYIVLILVPTLALLRDFMWKTHRRTFKPELYHTIQESRCFGDKIIRLPPSQSATTMLISGFAFTRPDRAATVVAHGRKMEQKLRDVLGMTM